MRTTPQCRQECRQPARHRGLGAARRRYDPRVLAACSQSPPAPRRHHTPAAPQTCRRRPRRRLCQTQTPATRPYRRSLPHSPSGRPFIAGCSPKLSKTWRQTARVEKSSQQAIFHFSTTVTASALSYLFIFAHDPLTVGQHTTKGANSNSPVSTTMPLIVHCSYSVCCGANLAGRDRQGPRLRSASSRTSRRRTFLMLCSLERTVDFSPRWKIHRVLPTRCSCCARQ